MLRIHRLALRLATAFALLFSLAAHAAPKPAQEAWVVDVPSLGRMALVGKTPERAIHNYVEGLIRRDVFPGSAAALRAWGRRITASAKNAPTLSSLAQNGKPISGIKLNALADLLGDASHLATRRTYADGLRGASFEPVFLPPADAYRHDKPVLDDVQHILLTGGDDIHPSMYASPITHAHVAELNLKRDRNEAHFIRAADDKALPIDGICRGSQILNVVAGGTLVQDLAADHLTDLAHAGPGFSPIFHAVRLAPGSVLAKTIGANEIPAVRSMHHEAVGELGIGVERVGISPDGVTEAIARDGGRVRGYQFHPEKALETEAARAIFRSMNERARDYATR